MRKFLSPNMPPADMDLIVILLFFTKDDFDIRLSMKGDMLLIKESESSLIVR